jgi:hypothetical protein
MKKILIINSINYRSDPRPLRIFKYFESKNKYFLKNIIIPKKIDDDEGLFDSFKSFNFLAVVKKIIFLKFNIYNEYYKKINKFLKTQNLPNYDYVYVSNINHLYAASNIIEKEKIIWDAREYYPEHYMQKFLWKFLYSNFYHSLIKKCIKNIIVGFTVSESLKKKYKDNFYKNFHVIYSLPEYENLKSKIIKKKIKIIHHGICSKTRKIENYIAVAKLLGKNYEVNCMLKIVDKVYFKYLKSLSANVKNFKFINPVATKKISKKINNYDIALIILLKESNNHMMSMPNKLFEAIQGKLCVISTPTIDVKNFINKNKCGCVSKEFSPESISTTIRSLNKKQIFSYKEMSKKISIKFSNKVNEKIWDKIL